MINRRDFIKTTTLAAAAAPLLAADAQAWPIAQSPPARVYPLRWAKCMENWRHDGKPPSQGGLAWVFARECDRDGTNVRGPLLRIELPPSRREGPHDHRLTWEDPNLVQGDVFSWRPVDGQNVGAYFYGDEAVGTVAVFLGGELKGWQLLESDIRMTLAEWQAMPSKGEDPHGFGCEPQLATRVDNSSG